MEYLNELEKISKKVVKTSENIEIYFENKTKFVKHVVELNMLKVQFDIQKLCFVINRFEKEVIEDFIEKISKRPTIIFDMDGVLINTNESFPVATSQTYKHFTNQELTSQEINEIKYQGGFNSDWDILMYLFKERGFDVKFEEMAKYYMGIYFDGKGGLIDAEKLILTEDHIKELIKDNNLSVFTGRDTASAMYTLEKWGIKKYFYPIITFEKVGWDHQKPDTKGVFLIKDEVITDEIYYLGDTVDDTICARNSKVNPIGVLPPRDKSEKLKSRLYEEGAITVLNSTTDLSQFLLSYNRQVDFEKI